MSFSLPFAKVVQREGSALREFAFLALPLHDRIAAILSGSLTFMADDDAVIDQSEALRAISARQRRTTST